MKGNEKMKKLFMLLALVMLGLGILTACGSSKSSLEKAARPVVSKIFYEQFGKRVDCLKVKITEKVDNNHYKATATLGNGNDIRIMIEDRGDSIYVTIPLKQ